MKKFLLKNLLPFAVAIVGMIVVWWIAYVGMGRNEELLPPPSACFKEVFSILGASAFWKAFSHTLLRVLLAFLLALIPSVIFAVIAYLCPVFGDFLTPIVSALRSLPVLAVSLILLVIFYADKTPIAVAFLSLFPMLYVGASSSLSAVDKELVEMSKVYKVPLMRRIFSLYLPSAAPFFLREAGASLSFALKLVVSAEVLAFTSNSLGGMMQEIRGYSGEMPTLFALVILSFVCGMVLEGIFTLGVRLWQRRKE